MNTHVRYLLIGAGGAGNAAAEAIRQHDRVGSIMLVGQEHSRPYFRPALSKQYLRRQKTRLDIVSDPVDWYAREQVGLSTGHRAAHLDTARRLVTLDNGDEIAFDRLLLATGASPKPLHVPGADLPNVFYLRTLDDCDRLHHAIDQAKAEGRSHPAPQNPAGDRPPRGRVAVMGSGLLATELAASLRQMDLHVDLIASRMHPWGKFAGESTGRFLVKYLENRGIAVHSNVSPERLEGDGRVQRVVLSDGQSIDCDFAIAAIGIVPNRELLRGTPIAAEKAILVDDHCRTNVQGIYAAGDCAAVLDPLFGKHRILDHWDSARILGAIAGANMAGAADARYDEVNSYFSEVFDLKLTAWGEGRFVDRRLLRGTPNIDTPDFAEIGVAKDGRVCQVLAIGRKAEHESLRQLVAKRFNVEGHEEEMKDPSQSI